MRLSVLVSCLVVVSAGCGTERIHLERDAVLHAGSRPDLERFLFVIEVDRVEADSASLLLYPVTSDPVEPTRVELRRGERYDVGDGDAIILLATDPAAQTATVRGLMNVEVKRGLLPRKRHPWERRLR